MENIRSPSEAHFTENPGNSGNSEYSGVSAKLAACRNPPYPTLILRAGNVYPDHLRRMRHICVAGFLFGNFETSEKPPVGVEIFRIPRSPQSPKNGNQEGPEYPPSGRFWFFLGARFRILKYLGVSAKLPAWRNRPYPALILWSGNVYPDHFCRMYLVL